jgi:hypothetical protein
MSQAMSQTATTDEQKRLWREAAAKATELKAAAVLQRPVEKRQRVAVPEVRVPPKPASLPRDMASGARVLAAPELTEGRFAGKATVLRAEGERLELDLGDNRVLAILAKIGGAPARVRQGATVELDYRVRDDPFDRQSRLALRLPEGGGLVSVLEGGTRPVTLQVPMFQLTATQVGKPELNTMNVEVRVGGERQVLKVGEIGEFKKAGLSVGLLGSIAYEGDAAAATEGNPYAINLTAWTRQ